MAECRVVMDGPPREMLTASNRARPNDDETDFIFLTATRIEAEWMKAKLESALRRTGFAGMVRIRSLRGGLAG